MAQQRQELATLPDGQTLSSVADTLSDVARRLRFRTALATLLAAVIVWALRREVNDLMLIDADGAVRLTAGVVVITGDNGNVDFEATGSQARLRVRAALGRFVVAQQWQEAWLVVGGAESVVVESHIADGERGIHVNSQSDQVQLQYRTVHPQPHAQPKTETSTPGWHLSAPRLRIEDAPLFHRSEGAVR